jgi:hypothetical protein
MPGITSSVSQYKNLYETIAFITVSATGVGAFFILFVVIWDILTRWTFIGNIDPGALFAFLPLLFILRFEPFMPLLTVWSLVMLVFSMVTQQKKNALIYCISVIFVVLFYVLWYVLTIT